MDPRTLTMAQAVCRVVIGSSLVLQPERASAAWIGRDSRRPGSQVLAAALGVRDAAIGAGILAALRTGGDVRPWVAGGVASDLVDLVATLRSSRELPAAAVAGVGALAAGSAALGTWLYAAAQRSP